MRMNKIITKNARLDGVFKNNAFKYNFTEKCIETIQ